MESGDERERKRIPIIIEWPYVNKVLNSKGVSSAFKMNGETVCCILQVTLQVAPVNMKRFDGGQYVTGRSKTGRKIPY